MSRDNPHSLLSSTLPQMWVVVPIMFLCVSWLVDLKKRIIDADIIVTDPDAFEKFPSVMFSPDLSLKLVQISYAGCNQVLKAVRDNNAVSVV